MAELNVFRYRSGNTSLHRLDIRCKLAILLMANMVALNAGLSAQGFLTLLSGILLVGQRIPILATIRQTRMFFFLLLFVFISRASFEPGATVLSMSLIAISKQGIASGLEYCWRLLLAFISGLLFVSTSKTADIKAGIQWFLKPIPLIPANRIATMLSLMLRFLPLILEQGQEIADAQKARAIENRKNPIRRLLLFSVPLLRGIFDTADQLILAMEARCYSEIRTDPALSFQLSDLMVLIGAMLATAAALIL